MASHSSLPVLGVFQRAKITSCHRNILRENETFPPALLRLFPSRPLRHITRMPRLGPSSRVLSHHQQQCAAEGTFESVPCQWPLVCRPAPTANTTRGYVNCGRTGRPLARDSACSQKVEQVESATRRVRREIHRAPLSCRQGFTLTAQLKVTERQTLKLPGQRPTCWGPRKIGDRKLERRG
jgi:hypothetical protein